MYLLWNWNAHWPRLPDEVIWTSVRIMYIDRSTGSWERINLHHTVRGIDRNSYLLSSHSILALMLVETAYKARPRCFEMSLDRGSVSTKTGTVTRDTACFHQKKARTSLSLVIILVPHPSKSADIHGRINYPLWLVVAEPLLWCTLD